MQRRVTLSVLDVNKGLLQFGKQFNYFIVRQLATNVQCGLTLLSAGVNLSHFSNEQLYKVDTLRFGCVMQGCDILIMLVVHIGTEIFVTVLIE